MADLSITAASVAKVSGAVIDTTYVAGETITAGQVLYVKSSDGKLYKAQCDGTTEESTVYGIALNGASSGQPVAVLTGGQITAGATLTVGAFYYLSATAGGICPYADLVSTNKVVQIFYGATSAIATLSKIVTGVAVP